MVTATLVESKIKVGEKLIRNLHEAGFPVQAALWLYLSEPDVWRLVIGTPLVKSVGPKATYTRIDDIVRESLDDDDLSLREISVVEPKDSLIAALRRTISTGSGVSGIRMSRNVIGNIFIEDAYIYRMT